MAFGFNFNGISSDPNKAISFNEAIAPAAGPAASLHLFYSVARAKEMLAQLQEAISQAEGNSTDD